AARSTSDAPQFAQNLIPGSTGEAQRGQFGPEPGAVRRRPQWGQNGRNPLARAPQKGQAIGSPGSRATGGRAMTRVPGTDAAPAPVVSPPPADAAAGLRPAGVLMGLRQCVQDCPARFVAPPR